MDVVFDVVEDRRKERTFTQQAERTFVAGWPTIDGHLYEKSAGWCAITSGNYQRHGFRVFERDGRSEKHTNIRHQERGVGISEQENVADGHPSLFVGVNLMPRADSNQK
jgi:hypothetical protein